MSTGATEASPAVTTDWASVALAGNPDVLVVLGPDYTIRWISASVERYGYQPADLIGRTPASVIHPDDLDYALGAFVEVRRKPGGHLPVQVRFRDASAHEYLMEVAAYTGEHMVVSLRDITGRYVLPTRRRELEELVQQLSNQVSSAAPGGLERVVIGGLAALGYFFGADAVTFSSVDMDRQEVRLEHEWIRPDSRSARTYRPIIATGELLWDASAPPGLGYLFLPSLPDLAATNPHAAALAEAGLHALLDVPLLHDGRPVSLLSARWTGDAFRWDDATASLVRIAAEILASVVQRMGTERRLEHQATRDGLTGLPNRLKLADVLAETLRDADPATPPALLFCDLDGFKEVNDRCGHTFGDRVLAEVARRLGEVVADVAFIARVGGDEFVVVVLADAEVGLDELSLGIRSAVLSLTAVDGVEIDIDVSIGRACWEDGDTAEDWLRRADAAMYEQKANRLV